RIEGASPPRHGAATLAERFTQLDVEERELVAEALKQADGNVSEAARLLGITRIMMRRRLKRCGLGARTPQERGGRRRSLDPAVTVRRPSRRGGWARRRVRASPSRGATSWAERPAGRPAELWAGPSSP